MLDFRGEIASARPAMTPLATTWLWCDFLSRTVENQLVDSGTLDTVYLWSSTPMSHSLLRKKSNLTGGIVRVLELYQA